MQSKDNQEKKIIYNDYRNLSGKITTKPHREILCNYKIKPGPEEKWRNASPFLLFRGKRQLAYTIRLGAWASLAQMPFSPTF